MSCPVAGCVCYVQLDRSAVYCAGWQMRRREFIKAITASAAGWPLTARAQQGERMRRVAVLMSVDNPEARANHAAFVQSLKQLGWVDGQNIDRNPLGRRYSLSNSQKCDWRDRSCARRG